MEKKVLSPPNYMYIKNSNYLKIWPLSRLIIGGTCVIQLKNSKNQNLDKFFVKEQKWNACRMLGETLCIYNIGIYTRTCVQFYV